MVINMNYMQSPVPSEDNPDSPDFGYSQKLFHIADGKLYSVFSPLQGRSYGKKPSFLGQPKPVTRDSRGRGRRNMRKGLKFHNFLPSESITSEKNESTLEEPWSVHAECRLREEHGTKQIMVSNWSVNSESSLGKDEEESFASSYSSVPPPPPLIKVQTGELITGSSSPDLSLSEMKIPDMVFSDNRFTDAGTSSEEMSLDSITFETLNQSQELEMKEENGNKKRRRKPLQTNRVIPYNKYLTLLNDEPLDLSSKSPPPSLLECQDLIPSSPMEIDNSIETNLVTKNIVLKQTLLPSSSSRRPKKKNTYKNSSPFKEISRILDQNSLLTKGNIHPPNEARPPISTLNLLLQQPPSCSMPPSFYTPPSSTNPTSDVSPLMTSFKLPRQVKGTKQKLIKKKLEDTFRDNGFLVKTKQVSDGDATFCKFRQLRKYSRYYMKSWHQHLPDEVHKLWKGFLPPKTVLPGSSKNSSPPL